LITQHTTYTQNLEPIALYWYQEIV
jgi:hypothetical protein